MAQKKPTKKVNSPKKDPKRVEKIAKQGVKAVDKAKRPPKARRSFVGALAPYLLLLLTIVLTVCLAAIHLFDSDVGSVGYALQLFFAGLFGGGTALLPLAMGYIGVMWCLHNVKWKESEMTAAYAIYRKAKNRLILRSVMAILTVLMVSVMFGVAADHGNFDFGYSWADGADELMGGGALGGMLGYVMVAAFQKIVSFILLGFLLVLFALLSVGLTPEYIFSKIRDKRLARREERQYLEEQSRSEEEQQQLEEQKRLARMEAIVAKQEEKAKKQQEKQQKNQMDMSVDEIMDLSDPKKEAKDDVYVGPSKEETEGATEVDPVQQMLGNMTDASAAQGMDFGGDGSLDTEEYSPLEDFFKEVNATEAAAAATEIAAAPLDLNKIGTDELLSDMVEVMPEEGEMAEEEEEPALPYVFPPIDLLEKNKNKTDTDYTAELQENAHRLLDTLKSFRINIKEITYSRGPTITRYELKPEAGVRVRSIANLVDDIALSLATSGVRIEAPIPGKPAVGIEVPNRNRATVYLRDLIDNQQFTDAKSRLTACLGMDVGGNPIYFDISKMPHMIIAGATGMGKSVCINCVIMSILYKAKPEDVKLILIDPKKVEFNLYKDIPHLYAPIVSEPKKAAGALASAVAEMERRFEMIEEVGVRDITSYNAATENDPYKEHMPHMVIIIDELADLMMTAPDDVETAICRLAQKARAAGIHIIIGTQRPSVDVITGLIKANIPSRIACTVASQVDSRTIIDVAGAEKLIGRGDMLFAPVGAAKPLRVQGAFVTEAEVENICTYIRENNSKAKYNSEFINRIEEAAAGIGNKKNSGGGMESMSGGDSDGGDSKFHEAVKLAVEEGKISTSLMQRRLGVGYGRAAKIIDTMEQMGYVSKPDGNKPRRVLLTAEEYARRITEGTLGDSDD